ncbi:peroxidase [Elysia marginata]|uniref:Peroxidase n=1 Tax=Elysia marginata TaxID=1093978 RepID=A0AAV4HJQ6_9GAST|nr:peroxidase [Elysia marginata]
MRCQKRLLRSQESRDSDDIKFKSSTCDSAGPEIRAMRTLHQSRTFELPQLSASEATNLIGFDKRNLQTCPPVELTAGCSATDLVYRTVDGSCNSLAHPDWGKSFTPPKRYIPSQYQDGIDAPRTLSITGRKLLSARYISSYVATKMSTPAPFSAMVMAFGQYIDHDFTGFPVIKLTTAPGVVVVVVAVAAAAAAAAVAAAVVVVVAAAEDVVLITVGVIVAAEIEFFAKREEGYVCKIGPCFPIKIEDDEDFFKGRKCMEFVRSNAAMDENEQYLTPREQLNALTSFIDASSVYGSTEDVNKFLRLPDGRLKTGKNNMLPDGGKTNCKIVDSSVDYCLFAGDHRVNVFVGLGVFHTIFHRLHNQLVDRLAIVNPHWQPEILYQEARKINAALHQHTTYTEYLPAILNDDHLDKYQLRPGNYKYNPSLNPSMANSFSTAAFRFGHSQVNDFLKVGKDQIRTETTLMRPNLVLTRFDDVTHGLAAQPADTVDRFFSESMTDRLFEKNGTMRDGLDLVSLNIQRGRDHGLPQYNAYRKFCGLPPVRTFDSSVFQPRNGLKHVYM